MNERLTPNDYETQKADVVRELVQEAIAESLVRTCLYCKRWFLRTRTDRHYCSNRCRAAASIERAKAR
jgi:hypothetical protein